jgi:hypothetical protein
MYVHDPEAVIDTLTRRAEFAEAELRRIEHERIERAEHDRQAVLEANERSRAAEREAARTAEADQIRRSSWLRYWTLPEQLPQLAAAEFSPVWIANHTPDDLLKWPPDDSIGAHAEELRHEPAAYATTEGDVPTLVAKARAMGLPV